MESSQERNLPATERKLQKARTDGQAARSRDLSHLAILGTGALVMLSLAPLLLEHLLQGMGQQLVFDAATVQSPSSMLNRLQHMAATGLIASGVFALLTAGAALLIKPAEAALVKRSPSKVQIRYSAMPHKA